MKQPSRRLLLAALSVLVVASLAVGVYGLALGAPASDPGTGTESGPATQSTVTTGHGTETTSAPDTAKRPAATDTPARTPRADIAHVEDGITIAESPTVTDPSELDDLERSEVTVVATQGYYPDDEVADLVAFRNDGTVIYHEADYGVYFDVDPVPGTEFTVEYLASAHFNDTTCDVVKTNKCTRDVIRQVNLTTGESETIYSEIIPRFYSARQHDADRINDTHLAVADIFNDSVFVLNTTSGEKVWEWRAEYDYSEDSGGKWYDWTHINDVEALPDGRLMASLRNQDSVVFLDPTEAPEDALLENWTLGVDDNHTILYEQHNPDYIPESRGGPAVLVGDSENHRAVEYQRVDGEWKRTWEWSRDDVNWVRDADRLPSGNTLIVNTRGDSVLAVGPNDDVVWEVDIGMPYDVERLGTGDESAGGMTADLRDEAPLYSETATTGENGGGPNDADGQNADTRRAGPFGVHPLAYGGFGVGLVSLAGVVALLWRSPTDG